MKSVGSIMRLALSLIGMLACTSAHAQEAFKLTDLGSSEVDYLTFGIRSLESDLRLDNLEACGSSDCKNVRTNYSVTFSASRPKAFPEDLSWPDGGAIFISVVEERKGEDSSLATQKGCKVRLNSLRMSSQRPESVLSLARFFVPEKDWRATRTINDDNPTSKRLKSITNQMFYAVTERHDWEKPSGLPDRTIWVSCLGTIQGDDFYETAQGHYPE